MNTRLFVADTGNNRVLVYNVASGTLASTEPASFVLGQTLLTTNTSGDTSSTLSSPEQITYDATSSRLFVVDQNNNRVLVFNVAPGTIANGEPASYVIGQADFTSNSTGTSSTTLNVPYGAVYDAKHQRLLVSDQTNARVLGYDVSTSTIANGEPATVVFGQPDFISGTPGDSQDAIGVPYGVAYDDLNGQIYVNDTGNQRIIVYAPIKIETDSLPDATVGDAYAQPINTANAQGTVTFSLLSGVLPPGMHLGSVDGTPTDSGTYTFTVQADDNIPGAGDVFDDQTFTLNVDAPVSGGGDSSNNNMIVAIASGGGGGGGYNVPPAAPSSPGASSTPTSTVSSSTAPVGISVTYTPTSTSTTFYFTRDLYLGMTNADVLAAQKFLNAQGFTLAASGAGSPGHETSYFPGALTKKAGQDLPAEICHRRPLNSAGLTVGTGYFGPLTRAFVNQLLGG